jgi:hypothetical protein
MSRLYSAAYRLYYWVFYRLAQLIAMGICEPKLRLGRRRHDAAVISPSTGGWGRRIRWFWP